MARTWFRRLREGEDGAVALIVAILTVALLLVVALVVDAGGLYAQRRTAQSAADAGALAGVQALPGDPASARSIAATYVGLNYPKATGAEVTIRSTYSANDTCEVRVTRSDAPLFFDRWATGRASSPVGASAAAVIASPSGMGAGVFPFGIMSKEPSGTSPFGYAFNELVRLKQPAQQGGSGNFQFMSLTDPAGSHIGASQIMWALANGGVPNPVYMGQSYMTKTGINGRQVTDKLSSWIGADSCSFAQIARMRPDGLVDLLDKECHRVIICPVIVDPGPPVQYGWWDMNGASRPALVIGFAYFYIEAMGTTGNDCWIDGRFIRPVGPEDVVEWGPVDPYGAVGYRLVK